MAQPEWVPRVDDSSFAGRLAVLMGRTRNTTVAKAVGVTSATVGLWLKGETKVPRGPGFDPERWAEKIASACGVPDKDAAAAGRWLLYGPDGLPTELLTAVLTSANTLAMAI